MRSIALFLIALLFLNASCSKSAALEDPIYEQSTIKEKTASPVPEKQEKLPTTDPKKSNSKAKTDDEDGTGSDNEES